MNARTGSGTSNVVSLLTSLEKAMQDLGLEESPKNGSELPVFQRYSKSNLFFKQAEALVIQK